LLENIHMPLPYREIDGDSMRKVHFCFHIRVVSKTIDGKVLNLNVYVVTF
jgi:hypothetical protein